MADLAQVANSLDAKNSRSFSNISSVSVSNNIEVVDPNIIDRTNGVKIIKLVIDDSFICYSKVADLREEIKYLHSINHGDIVVVVVSDSDLAWLLYVHSN